MNNDVLVIKIRNGDDDAFRQLLSNHHNMIYKIINNYLLDRGDFSIDKEELYQEASLILYNAVFSYEENKNMKFSSYAYILIRSRILNILRDYARIYTEEMYSIDNTYNYDKYLRYTVEENPVSYHKEKEFKKNLDGFMKTLNREDRQILRLKENDCTYKDISEIMNINIKRIDNRLTSLRKKFNNYMDDK